MLPSTGATNTRATEYPILDTESELTLKSISNTFSHPCSSSSTLQIPTLRSFLPTTSLAPFATAILPVFLDPPRKLILRA
jgi:hypothetical protein